VSQITRRALLESAAKSGIALGAGGLIAACGSASTSGAGGDGGTPKRGGEILGGLIGGSSSDTIDPNGPVNVTDYARVAQLFEGLVWLNAGAQQYNRLAEEITPNKDATVWTIRLRNGLTFHNGKDVTADDLIFSINRVVDPKAPGEAANALHGIDAGGMKKVDKRTITVPFAKPYSTLPQALATNVTVYVVPADFDPKSPVGTGPFKYQSFTPGRQSVFVRNENYWNHPLPYVDRVTLTNYSDQSSQLNALLSGQVNVINELSQSVVGTVTGSHKKAVISPGGGWNPFTMRVDQPPFNDVRVRQAFRFAVDRQKMLDTAFGGHGTMGNDVFSIWAPEHDHGLPQRTYDPERAKALLKQAGHESLSIQMVTADIAQGSTAMAQVFAQQAAASNINVHLRKTTVTDFYGPNYLKWQFAQDFWYYAPYFAQVNQATLPTSPFNETHFANPTYISLYRQGLATLDERKRAEIAHEMQTIDYNEGGYVIPFFPPVIDGYSPSVHGIVPSKTGGSFNNWDFAHMWVA
jgi:peptide/nickel transport system substrate-binding protein